MTYDSDVISGFPSNVNIGNPNESKGLPVTTSKTDNAKSPSKVETPSISPDCILDTMSLVYRPDSLIEIRALEYKVKLDGEKDFDAKRERTLHGYFDSPEKAAFAVESLIKRGGSGSIYVGLNPRPSGLANYVSALNLIERAENTTTKADIDMIEWILVDIDPIKRHKRANATKEEYANGEEVYNQVCVFLDENSIECVKACSGNGFYCLIPIEPIPNNSENEERVKRAIEGISQRFSNEKAKIDEIVFNPDRIIRVLGTINTKSKNKAYHRGSWIEAPSKLERNDPGILEHLAGPVDTVRQKTTSTQPPNGLGAFDMARYLTDHGQPYEKKDDKFKLTVCPFNPDHGADSAVWQDAAGKFCFKCFHDGCKDNGWREFRAKISGEAKLIAYHSGGGSVSSSQTTDDLDAVIEEKNKIWTMILIGTKPAVRIKIKAPDGRPKYILMGVDDFKSYYSNEKVRIGNKLESIAKVWISHSSRNHALGLVFMPGKGSNVNGYLNLYEGLRYEARKGASVSRTFDHILNVICDGDVALYEWLCDWIADMIQNPGNKPGTSVVLYSAEKGTGKSTLLKILSELVGVHAATVANPRHLLGGFNGHLADKIIVLVEEAVWGGNKQEEGALKALITEKRFTMELKFKDPIEVENHIHLMMATNSTWSTPAGIHERRFLVLDVSTKHCQDVDYFNDLYAEIDAPGYYEALMHEFMNRGIVSNLRTAPKTKALLTQIEHSMTPIQSWFYDMLASESNDIESYDWIGCVPVSKLYKAYQEHAQGRGNARSLLTNNAFSRELFKICPVLISTRQYFSGSQQRAITFCEIDKCRKSFEKTVGIGIDWPKKETTTP